MAEIHKEFLASWDGRALPEAWLEHWLKHGDHLEDRSREEYRGGVGVCVPSWPRGSGVCKPDRFGPDNREMCAATCARQRCTGCCFCVGVPLPVYLEIHTGEPLPRNQTVIGLDRPLDVIGWVTVEHVQQMVTQELPHPGCLTRTQASLSTRAVPAYLLDRTVQDDRPLDFGYNFGRVICLPGAVRSHVAADQLAEYAERLACSGTLVEILSGDSCECTLGPDVLTRRDAHITRHAQVVKQAHEVAKQEWLLARQGESDWIALNQPGRRDLDEQVQFEASRGCGQRNPSLDGTRSKPHQQLREGDIVYHPPRTGFSGANEPSWYADEFETYTGCSTQPYVAVVVKVHRKEVYFEGVGRRAIPFGGVDLLHWDLDRLQFGRVRQEVKMPFTLFPPCCGRGAACPHLLLTIELGRWQWPNGDDLRGWAR